MAAIKKRGRSRALSRSKPSKATATTSRAAADSGAAQPSASANAADLDALREQIDHIDRALLDRLNERARLVQRVGRIKAKHDTPVYSAARERDLIEALQRKNAGPFPNAALRNVFREVISGTRSLEKRLSVAYLGPQGTFSHQAALQQFGSQVDLLECATIDEVFQAVERKRADHGIVPVENTTQGAVTPTLDCFLESDVALCGEVHVRIQHNLLSKTGKRSAVRRIASHAQPLAQCRLWLEANLPQIERLETPSTAAAAKLAAKDASTAAIGSEIAAELYGLEIIERAIEDRADNTTRFLILGMTEPAASGHDLTSVVFTAARDEAGALFRLLDPFAQNGVNLTSIQSRPMPGRPWEYVFFFDLEGHRSEAKVAKALREAAKRARSCKVLGSFPAALTAGDASAESGR